MSHIKINNLKIGFPILIFWSIGIGLLLIIIFFFNLNATLRTNWTSGSKITYDVDDVLLKPGELSFKGSTALINLSLLTNNLQESDNKKVVVLNNQKVYQAILKKKIETANQKSKENKSKPTNSGVRFLPIPD